MSTWNYEHLQTWIRNGCQENTNVIELWLGGNDLTSIPPEIGKLKGLTMLALSGNKLTFIPPEIGHLRRLISLYLSRNQLTSIPPEIGQLQNLTVLTLEGNQLTSIPPEIGDLRSLTELALYNNQLTSIPPEIGQLQRLTRLNLSGNPIEHYPINVQRLMMRQRWVGPSIYTDTQSVHTSSIQSSIKESILRLLKEKILEKDIIPLILSDPDLEPFTKESLIEYSKDESVHTELNVSFSDLLVLVWNRIMVSPNAEEIKAVLNTEMQDAECKCFTGRISRLVNCLNGFDPLVSVQISDNEQIGAIISLVKIHLEDKGEYTIEKHKEEAERRLKELHIKEEEIVVWLSYIE